MYKVFIDHKPIVIISKDELSTNSPYIEFKDGLTIEADIQPNLKDISLENPFQIVCKNPDAAFKYLFYDFLKIRAAGGIVQRKEKYLVIKRKGLWDIPKGKIDKGEDKKTACVREIEEECGISGHRIVRPLTNTYHIMNYKGRKALKKTYWYLLTYSGPKETVPEKLEGITKAKWMTEEQLMAIRGKTYGSINELLDAFVLQKA